MKPEEVIQNEIKELEDRLSKLKLALTALGVPEFKIEGYAISGGLYDTLIGKEKYDVITEFREYMTPFIQPNVLESILYEFTMKLNTDQLKEYIEEHKKQHTSGILRKTQMYRVECSKEESGIDWKESIKGMDYWYKLLR